MGGFFFLFQSASLLWYLLYFDLTLSLSDRHALMHTPDLQDDIHQAAILNKNAARYLSWGGSRDRRCGQGNFRLESELHSSMFLQATGVDSPESRSQRYSSRIRDCGSDWTAETPERRWRSISSLSGLVDWGWRESCEKSGIMLKYFKSTPGSELKFPTRCTLLKVG